MTNIVDKYLHNYAEPECQSVRKLFMNAQKSYPYCLVIPAYNESTVFLERFKQHPKAAQCLLILVINQPDDKVQGDHSGTAENKALHDHVREFNQELNTEGLVSYIRHSALDVLLVERFRAGSTIPKKQGVGLARKIGADIAITLKQLKVFTGDWLYSSDADAHLPDNYFSLPASSNSVSAYVFNFTHNAKNNGENGENTELKNITDATQMYEQAIKYYRDALDWAGSPYAFYTLGSTLAFDTQAYCQVRGFPKRAAAEDFYLLNKLAKVGSIAYRQDITLHIDARISDRVPFGTGPAVKHIIEEKKNQRPYLYYSPHIFLALKTWLKWVTAQIHLAFDSSTPLPQMLGLDNTLLPDSITKACVDLEFFTFVTHASKQCKNKQAALHHFHNWFDGFKTLKFIHYIQANYHPALPLEEALQQACELFTQPAPTLVLTKTSQPEKNH